jgi:hypothetical protein
LAAKESISENDNAGLQEEHRPKYCYRDVDIDSGVGLVGRYVPPHSVYRSLAEDLVRSEEEFVRELAEERK